MMLRRPTTRRPGLSLVEVLVGFGILGIGVTSVITLFPYSALTLGQALKDDRSVTCAVSADGFLRDYYNRNVVEVEQSGTASTEPWYVAMDSPGTLNGVALPLPPADGPSYPVAIDPMGYVARPFPRTDQNWIGDYPTGPTSLTGVARRPLGITDPNRNPPWTYDVRLLSLRTCSQMDGLSYNEDGTVDQTAPEKRELRYNWMWVVQRPTNRVRYTVRMQVVVFDKRVHMYAPIRAEALTSAYFNPGDTQITNVPANTEVRKGSWVMDAGNPVAGLRHAEFYRVLSVIDMGNGFITLEVHKPISRPDGNTAPYSATLVSMPAVIDVYERPMMTVSGTP